VYRRSLIYNQCWEDPAVDRQALRLTPADRVLVITSAGCNALDYALTGARVMAVDANPRQNHLLELKLAGIRRLDFDAFFALFGAGGDRRALDMYGVLRPELSEGAREFWDGEIAAFQPAAARGGSFYYAGTAGLVAYTLRWYIERVAGAAGAVERLLAASTISEQLAIYAADLRERILGEGLLKLVGSAGVLALLGVPDAQRRMLRARPGGVVGYLRERLDYVMALVPLRENYFWSVYLSGRYLPASCPEYLKEANFARLKSGLADNVRLCTATVTECLTREPSGFSAFVLLDHMDWLAGQPRLLEEEWEQIFATAAPGARVIFRSGAPDAAFLPPAVTERLLFEPERARALHLQDRVGTYGSFHIARPLPVC
jgi:S-adenosylmethionine-diacylglycerol 3-amino-3-carboxypropyl transferase